ncbi:MAG: GDYXXLXY domain-containing protein [Pseudomonadota bacterium]
MTSRKLLVGILLATILGQGVILIGMVVKAAMPLWVGQSVPVETVPVDPRSLLRGNYARLNYAFSRLPKKLFDGATPKRPGEVVYVVLQRGDNGLYEASAASLTRPDSGVFLRGRVTRAYSPYRIRYGIEAWFAPKVAALALEKDLADGGIAELRVTSDGQAAIESVRGRGTR